MKRLLVVGLALLGISVLPLSAGLASGRYNPSEPNSHPKTKGVPPRPGQIAPNVNMTDTSGRSFTLSAYRGKTVVLEWINFECPYVDRHYSSGNMQAVQRAAMGQNVVWLTVFSSAQGKQGFQDARGADYFTAQKNSSPNAKVLDPTGTVARAFGARTTPHMFVIAPSGRIAYAGAIDDVPRARVPDGVSPTNYVLAALDALRAGQTPNPSATTAYGCSIKY